MSVSIALCTNETNQASKVWPFGIGGGRGKGVCCLWRRAFKQSGFFEGPLPSLQLWTGAEFIEERRETLKASHVQTAAKADTLPSSPHTNMYESMLRLPSPPLSSSLQPQRRRRTKPWLFSLHLLSPSPLLFFGEIAVLVAI